MLPILHSYYFEIGTGHKASCVLYVVVRSCVMFCGTLQKFGHQCSNVCCYYINRCKLMQCCEDLYPKLNFAVENDVLLLLLLFSQENFILYYTSSHNMNRLQQ